jgi:NAD+ diphosphatase
MPFSPPLTYAGSRIDRLSDQRRDEARVRSLRADPRAATIAIAGEAIVLAKRGMGFDCWLNAAELERTGPPVDAAVLGTRDDIPRLCAALPESRADFIREAGGFIAVDLRSLALQGLVPPEDLSAIATAKALLFWHSRHRFCAHCGGETASAEGGWRRDCAACGGHHFPRTDPCVIMLAIHGDQCLLARQSRFPPGMWSCLAGFVEPGESLEEAVRRETLEEAGLPTARVRYFASQPWAFPMSMMIGCFAEATSATIRLDEIELEAGRWVSRDEARLLLAGKHPARQFAPPRIAIAHHLISAFAERGSAVFD